MYARITLVLSLCYSLCFAFDLKAQNCLKSTDNIPGVFSGESVMIDTCTSTAGHLVAYTKKGITVEFKFYVLDLPWAPDTATVNATWQDIDTNYNFISEKFDTLEQMFGAYLFRKKRPHVVDSASYGSKIFELIFNNHVNVDSVLCYLNTSENINVNFSRYPASQCYTPTDPAFKQNKLLEEIAGAGLDASVGTLATDSHKLGWLWHLYAIQCPMAWEITKGRHDITIGMWDVWNDSKNSNSFSVSHPDLTSGNFIYIPKLDDTQDGGYSFPLTRNTGLQWLNHGISGFSVAAAKGDNGMGMAGSAPNASVLAVGHTGTEGSNLVDNSKAWTIDLNTANQKLDHIMVMNYSQRYGVGWEDEVKNGMAIVASGGNLIGDENSNTANYNWPFAQAHQNTFLQNGQVIQHFNGIPIFPAGDAKNLDGDQSNPDLDIKPISVGAIKDGRNVSQCYGTGVLNRGTYDGTTPTIDPTYNIASGTNKFSRTTNFKQREIDKKEAFLDVVAPAINLLMFPTKIHKDTPLSNYTLENGTSFSAPIVSGIVSMMRSVDTAAGVTDVSSLNKNNLHWMHRKIYDIVTFTADKILDRGEIAAPVQSANKISYYPPNSSFPVQLDYKVYNQTNEPVNYDKLNRSWSQRLGFGLINAYRCVAHSIRTKGAYLYNTSSTLSFPSNSDELEGYVVRNTGTERFKRLLHFGAWKQNNVRVLDQGGIVFPDDPAYINNNGKTILNKNGSNNIVLTVPNNSTDTCVLAIDGLVTTENGATTDPAKLNTIQTAEGNGKILLTGYLENVGVKGRTCISNLTIDGRNGNACRLSLGNAGFTSEVYGRVTQKNNGEYYIDKGKSILKPGAVIDLQGTKNFRITEGGSVEMEYASSIGKLVFDNAEKTNLLKDSDKEIVVEANSKFIVKSEAKVDIRARVRVKAGGEFLIKEDAKVNLKAFWIEPGGKMIVEPGAKLALDDQDANYIGRGYCNGELVIKGRPEIKNSDGVITQQRKPVYLTGKINQFGSRSAISQNQTTCELLKGMSSITVSGSLFLMNQTQVVPKITLQDVDSKGIYFQFNAASVDVIRNCNFVSDRWLAKSFTGLGSINTFLSQPIIDFSYSSKIGVLRAFAVSKCTFSDENLSLSNTINTFHGLDYGYDVMKRWRDGYPFTSNQEFSSYKDSLYRIAGIYVSGSDYLVVENCKFNKLAYGVKTFKVGSVAITSNTFNTCDNGIFDEGSYNSFRVCQNKFNLTTAGVVSEGSRSGLINGNIFGETVAVDNITAVKGNGIAINALSSANQFIYDNKFNNSLKSIRSESNTTLTILVKPGARCFYGGRNDFSVVEFPDMTPYQPKFSGLPNVRYDVNFTAHGNIFVQGGFNRFGKYTQYHLFYELPYAAPKISAVQNNRWENPNGTFAVRKDVSQPIITSGSPLNVAYSDPGNSQCGATTPCSSGVQPSTPPYYYSFAEKYNDYYANDGNWGDLDPNDLLLDTLYENARNMMKQDTIEAGYRRDKMHDAIQAAMIQSYSNPKIDTLISDFYQLSVATDTTTIVNTTALMLLGEIYERREHADSAISNYQKIVGQYPSSSDSIPAAWRIQRIQAEELDSLSRFTYNVDEEDGSLLTFPINNAYYTALGAFNDRVYRDIRRTGFVVDSAAQIILGRGADNNYSDRNILPTQNILEQNTPNPFDDFTIIKYSVIEDGPVRISVYDNLGNEVAMLQNGFMKSGTYEIRFDAQLLSDGIYYCRLVTDYDVLSSQMILIK